MIEFSHLMASLNQAEVPRIPEPVYTDLVSWISREIPDETLSEFVVWSFGCISDSELPSTWTHQGFFSPHYSKKSIFAVLALIMRSKPDVLRSELPSQGNKAFSLTVWMIKQACQSDLHVGLYSWVRYLLPLLITDLHCNCLILKLVDIILEKPGALTKLENHPVWGKQLLIPPSSFDNLLRLKFSPTSPTVMDKTRFVKIYGSLKRVALAGALKRKAIIQQIFTVSLRLAGEEGNPVLAKEAAEMAFWSLTEDYYVCWRLWYNISKENRAASVVLLKTLLEKWNKHSLKLPSSSPPPDAMSEFIQCVFTLSLVVADDEGNTDLAREATEIAIWSLAKNFFCWALWGCLCRDYLHASLGLVENLVNVFKVHSPKLSSSREEGMTEFIANIFRVSLRLAGEGNPIVARKAVERI
ncbi:unnamed protein product [Eruca vesicaria subsp. sativa]|uniref:Uncharacterized protein n=1 Tax=Eruca vesicaria subsp. sativa TaxID=29727 RepID=A0ABC8ITL2_ERUVS|nr:unnamed protein product [Eruca vesicaria subsp. sativa]